ncbi:sensor histidine kinase [Limibacter armeniacum]|uniref:sensor histidine kinase n=1 Tax=Limibacter armeniacum TaxID=466084 RepID=UPI002FE5F837
MLRWIKKYKGFLMGLGTLCVLTQLLSSIGFIRIDSSEVTVNTILFIFWWIVLSLPFHYYHFLKKRHHTVKKVLLLILLMVVMILQDSYLNIPDNPLSIFMIITFWMGCVYLVVPTFFKKYSPYFIAAYALIFVYWTYVRLASGSFEVYQQEHKASVIIWFLLPIPLVFVLWVYEQWKWLKSLKADKAAAELALLKTQVNPHFFFNTLNNLYALTVQHSDKAPEVILKLSDMMRYTIYEGKKDLVSLGDEVTYLQHYIDLHSIRYHKKVDLQFDHSHCQEEVKVAPLLFIILLENAFKHGVENLEADAYIHMTLSSTDDVIHFTICNNFDPSEKSETKGIGLENLKRRLSMIYPHRHHLEIKEEGEQFQVNLSIQTI